MTTGFMNLERDRRFIATARVLLCLVVVAWSPACTSKSKARVQAQAAFYAGQAQALAPTRPQLVTIRGNVANPTIEWKEGLTLAQALIQAEWRGHSDPRNILLRRGGSTWAINPKRLVNRQIEDPALEPGDIIELR
jgi:hypothetical protein